MKRLTVAIIVCAALAGILLRPMPVRAADLVVTLTGKIVVQYPNEEQKKTVTIVVHKAKTTSGVPFDALKGKIIHVIGQKRNEVGKYDDHVVLLTGTMKDNNSKIDVSSVKKPLPRIEDEKK